MTDIYDGDPLILIGPNGADMNFQGGQPEMDPGFYNHINFSLLTEAGWCGDDIEPDVNKRFTGKYIASTKTPITRTSLIDNDKAAISDLSNGDEFGDIQAETNNPNSQSLNTLITVTPPSSDPLQLRLNRVGQNWLNIFSENNQA